MVAEADTPLRRVNGKAFAPLRAVEGVTPKQFWDDIYPAGEPVILRRHCADWPSVQMADAPDTDFAKYLVDHNPQGSVNLFLGDGDMGGRYFYTPDYKGFNFSPKTAPFGAFLQKLLQIGQSGDSVNLYAGATPTSTLLPGFADAQNSDFPPDGTPPLAWIGNRSRVAPHYDSSDNIACCVRGPRTFLVFPPEQIGNLYVGPIDYNMAGQPASIVDPRNVDTDTFPQYARAEDAAKIAHLSPGDAIFIPSLWWHYVESRSNLSMLVNYWWLDGNPGPAIASLAHAVMNLRDLPAHHRRAWKLYFDHYVFSDDAPAALDHIPEPIRGVLGERSPARDARIKAFLKNTLG